jgi:hypothetical protein
VTACQRFPFGTSGDDERAQVLRRVESRGGRLPGVDIEMTCPSCGSTSVVGTGGSFEPRGELNGASIYRCTNCQVGLRVKHSLRSMITKRATAEVIQPTLWRRMQEEWDRIGQYS